MASTMSRRQCPAGRPPPPCFHAGAAKAGPVTACSASLVSDGYRGARVLRLIPPGQHPHATAGPAAGQCLAPRHACRIAWARAGPAAFLIVTNRDHGPAPVPRRCDTPQISRNQPARASRLHATPAGEQCSRA
jgi:hypothetical protein